MLKRIVNLSLLANLIFLGNSAIAEKTSELTVIATVPPRPCTYPDRCKPIEPSITTSVIVEDGIIRYVGSYPSVTRTADLISIMF